MYIHFTDQAQKAIQLASEEARRLQHEYVGTEHVLLGLIREIDGFASRVLLHCGMDLLDIREQVLNIVGFGPEQPIEGILPRTPRAKMVVKYAMEEANNLHQTQLGTAQLLLGILREKEGVGAQVLENFGVDFEVLRTRILDLLVEGLDDTVSQETFDYRIGPEENPVRVHDPQKKGTKRTKITVSVIPIKTAQIDDLSMELAAQLAQRWHQEYIAKYGHPWSNDWDEQLALSLQGENGQALQHGINEKWYPWWKQLLLKLSTDGIFETPDCPDEWRIRE